jgi:prepilin-type processing-associated H-X9-DG protein
MRALAQAAVNFETSKAGGFPPSQHAIFPNGIPNSNAPVVEKHRWATWAVWIFPYLEQNAIFEAWQDPTISPWLPPAGPLTGPAPLLPPNPLAGTYVTTLQCPSDPKSARDFRVNSYICNAGFYPHTGAGAPINSAPSNQFTFANIQRKANGVFIDRANFALGNFGAPPKVGLGDLTDGASHTVLFSESLTAANWDIVVQGMSPSYVGASANMVWLHVAEAPPPQPGIRPNPITKSVITPGPVLPHMRLNYRNLPVVPNGVETWRPSSSHSGTVSMAFADGSTRSVNNQIAYHVYQSIMTPDNLRSDMPVVYTATDRDLE